MVRALEKYIRPGVKATPFCPGCGHGILMGLILRAIDELKLDMKKMSLSQASDVRPGFQAPTMMETPSIPFMEGHWLLQRAPNFTILNSVSWWSAVMETFPPSAETISSMQRGEILISKSSVQII